MYNNCSEMKTIFVVFFHECFIKTLRTLEVASFIHGKKASVCALAHTNFANKVKK